MQIRDGSVLPYCAVRYALGRHSTIVSSLIYDKCKKNGAWSIDDTDWKRFREAVERERKRRDLHRD